MEVSMSEDFWPTICFIVIAAVAFGWLWRFGFKNTYFNLWVTFKIRCVIVPLYKLAVRVGDFYLTRYYRYPEKMYVTEKNDRGQTIYKRNPKTDYNLQIWGWCQSLKRKMERRFIKRYGVSLQYSLLSNE